eukprot:11179933-Lingulodinium_polyedra.AAC.1
MFVDWARHLIATRQRPEQPISAILQIETKETQRTRETHHLIPPTLLAGFPQNVAAAAAARLGLGVVQICPKRVYRHLAKRHNSKSLHG